MSNLSDFASKKFSNRLFFAGPASRTWNVPYSTREIEVHAWGGGANASGNCSGGGGGYATARLNVSGGEAVAITAGGAGGTSTVTLPGQSPNSPISATGGSQCTAGAGSVSLAPPHPTNWCFTASGGSGWCVPVGWASARVGGGGGGAGSPMGNGKAGGYGASWLCPGTNLARTGAAGGSAIGPGTPATLNGNFAGGGTSFYDPSWFAINGDNFVGKGADFGSSGSAGGFLGGGSSGGWALNGTDANGLCAYSGSPGKGAGFGGGSGGSTCSFSYHYCYASQSFPGGCAGAGFVIVYY